MSYNMTSDLGLVSFEEVCDSKQGALLVASGGLDSAYLLWKYVKTRTAPVHVHHFDLYPSARTRAERRALENQLEWLGKDKFQLHTSKLETEHTGALLGDWYLTALLSLELALANKLSYIVIGDELEDSYVRDQSFAVMPKQKKDLFVQMGEFIRTYSGGRVELCTASETNRLSEAYDQMDPEFLKLTFSCRDPGSSVYWSWACGSCASCMKNKHFGWWERIGKEVGHQV